MSEVEIPSNFCPSPWIETFMDTAGNVHLCCLMTTPRHSLWKHSNDENKNFYNIPEFQDARHRILNNERMEGCKQCWKLESQGIVSARQESLHKYRDLVPEILAKRETFVPYPRRLDLRYSPKCNIQCKMCIPHASDQISKRIEVLKAAGIDNTFTQRGNPIVNQSNFMTEHVRENPIANEFFFAGGEPFIMPEFHSFLDDFISTGRAASTKLHILTNLTAVNDSILDKMVQFKAIDFSCSMDGVGAELEYQRWPSKWEKIRTNFERVVAKALKYPHLRPTIAPCITHLNMRCLGDFLEFLYDREYRVTYSGMKMVFDEDQLDHRLVPLKYRPEIVANIDRALGKIGHKMLRHDFKNWKQFSESLVNEKFELTEFVALRLQDAVAAWDFGRPQKWRDLYPWADELLAEAEKFRPFPTYGIEELKASIPASLVKSSNFSITPQPEFMTENLAPV